MKNMHVKKVSAHMNVNQDADVIIKKICLQDARVGGQHTGSQSWPGDCPKAKGSEQVKQIAIRGLQI